jgi:L-seryl-tRNA(Ser) seleniumtransferase
VDELRKIPGMDTFLNQIEIKNLITASNSNHVKYCIRVVLKELKEEIKAGEKIPKQEIILNRIQQKFLNLKQKKLRKVINATGVINHTNLGRVPYGEAMLQEVMLQLKGYNNLEFDLVKGRRGSRNSHTADILKYLTGAEDVLIVNNNAAAVMLILRSFAKGKEVIVSRGELIEIGGSFRIPDILAASDCIMVEIGTTNKTKISDYQNAINKETAILLKTHRSNYTIVGFTEEVSLKELVAIGKKNKIPVLYDMGSGLLGQTVFKGFTNEPDVQQCLNTGVDLICFSGDKLLGGPQAGIIAGKKTLIAKLKRDPMLRALRVDKINVAFLETICSYYLNDHDLISKNLLFKTLNQTQKQLKQKANNLKEKLLTHGIETEIQASGGQFGGGALPGEVIKSTALCLSFDSFSNKQRSLLAKQMHHELLQHKKPLLSILKRGKIYFDMLTLVEEETDIIAEIINETYKNLSK